MRELNKHKVIGKLGIEDPSKIHWNRGYIEDTLELTASNEDGTLTLTPTNMTEVKATVLISIDPRLLALGATYTAIVEAGETPLVFIPPHVDDIPADVIIRGYLV